MKFQREDDALSIDMTPLVDCIFAIILFLLVASSFVEGMEQDLSITLPSTGRELKVKAAPAKPIVVNVRNLPGGQAQYRYDNEPISLNGLKVVMSKRKEFERDPSVVIRGDENVQFKHVAKVLDCCGEAGVTKISMAVRIAEEAPPQP